MGRTQKTIDVQDATATIDQEKFAGAMEQLRNEESAKTLALTEQNQRVVTLAKELNYQGSTELAVLENSARDAIRRIGMGIFELGAYLLLLKEGCAYGEFTPTLERLGLSVDSAGRYMAVTRRFSNSASTRNLETLGFTKMVELLPLDDNQLDDLVDDGQTGELDLDDVSRMSVKELRAAVRKERAETAKQTRRAERQEAVNAELHEEVQLVKLEKPDAHLKRLLAEAADIQSGALGLIQGSFNNVLKELNKCGSDQRLFMAGMVSQLIAELTKARNEYDLPALDGNGKPEWQQWAEAQGQGGKKVAA